MSMLGVAMTKPALVFGGAATARAGAVNPHA